MPSLPDGKALSYAERAAQIARTPTPLLVKGDHRLLRDIDRPLPGDPLHHTSRKTATTPLRRRHKSLLSLRGAAARDEANGGDKHNKLRPNDMTFLDNEDEGGGGDDDNDDDNDPRPAASAGPLRELARKRSQYFEDAFAARRDAKHASTPTQDRVRAEAPVLAELRTNVIIADELAVITALATHLATRYRRQPSSVVVALQQSACLCFGGGFAPAYVLAVHALPGELLPATNKRNGALLQRHLACALGVPPTQGLVRFVPVPEPNLAYGGKTALWHMEDAAPEGQRGVGAAVSSSLSTAARSTSRADAQSLTGRKHKSSRKLSVKSLASFRSPSSSPEQESSSFDNSVPVPPVRAARRASHQNHKDDDSGVENNNSNTNGNATEDFDSDPNRSTTTFVLPVIPERVFKESLCGGERDGASAAATEIKQQTTRGTKSEASVRTRASSRRSTGSGGGGSTLGDGYAMIEQVAAELATIPRPATTGPPERKPSRRARRTKSFMATLFGRSAGSGR